MWRLVHTMLGVPVETVSARRRRQRRAADTRQGYEAHNWTRPVWTPDYRMLGVPVETVSARRRRQRRAAAARPSPHTATRVGWRELFCREVRKVCPEADIRFVQERNVTLTHSTNRVVSIAGKAGTAGLSLAGAAQNAAGEAGAAGLLLAGAAHNSNCLGSGRDPDQQCLGVNQVSARLNCHLSQIIEELAKTVQSNSETVLALGRHLTQIVDNMSQAVQLNSSVTQNLALSTQSLAMSISGMVWSNCQASLLPTAPLSTREDTDACRPHLNDQPLLACKHGSSCRFFAAGVCKFSHETSVGTQVAVEARDPADFVAEASSGSPVQRPGTLVAGARTGVKVPSATQDSPNLPFWGPAGAPHQNLDLVKPPKPFVEARPECRYGTECRFWATGSCRFRHNAAGMLQTMPHLGPSRHKEVEEALPIKNVEPGALADLHEPPSSSFYGLQGPEFSTFTLQHEETEAAVSTQSSGSEAPAVPHQPSGFSLNDLQGSGFGSVCPAAEDASWSPAQSHTKLVAGARTAVNWSSTTQDSQHPTFWGPAGPQNQKLDLGRLPKPSKRPPVALRGARRPPKARFGTTQQDDKLPPPDCDTTPPLDQLDPGTVANKALVDPCCLPESGPQVVVGPQIPGHLGVQCAPSQSPAFPSTAPFAFGDLVTIHGLVSETGITWNGKQGRVAQACVPGTARVGVVIEGQVSSKSLSPANLKLIPEHLLPGDDSEPDGRHCTSNADDARPSGHSLVACPSGGDWTCDRCMQDVPDGQLVYGCQPCDLGSCHNC